MNNTVVFETKCWEKDWKILINNDGLKRKLDTIGYSFTKKVLYINNVEDVVEVRRAADKLVTKVIDQYYVVDDYADIVLDKYGIDKDSFNGGYYYSIQELVSVHLTDSDFLLHLSGDSFIEGNAENFINKSIKVMNSNPKVWVSNPTWDRCYDAAKVESMQTSWGGEDDDFYYCCSFSDQCYLIKPVNFDKDIYHDICKEAIVFPGYGGESFEKRVFSYLYNNKLLRSVSKHLSYTRSKY